MLLKFWQNPEFIRHCRSELRRSRMTTVALVVLFVCGLTILGSWATERAGRQSESEPYDFTVQLPSGEMQRIQEPPIAVATALKSYSPLMFMQFGVLTF